MDNLVYKEPKDDIEIIPVMCVELKATQDLLDHYYDLWKDYILFEPEGPKADRYDKIISVLSKRIDTMEKSLLDEYEMIKPTKEENLQ